MPEHDDPNSAAVGGDAWHPSTEQLRGHLDGRLPATESDRIAEHLDGCERCVAALDGLESPAVLARSGDADAPTVDARWMRRAVRRTLLRTAFNAAALLLVGAIALQALGGLVFNPLFVQRGDRVPRSTIASIDVPIMTNPGAEIRELNSEPGVLRRTTEVDVERPVGVTMSRLGGYTTRLGPLGMSTPSDSLVTALGPVLSEQPDRSMIDFEADRLGDGTAVTVQLLWQEPLGLDEANAVTGGDDDVALLWVGFDAPQLSEDGPWFQLGYGACHDIPDFMREPRSGGFGMSGGFRSFPPDPGNGAQHALEQLRRATSNLAETGWLDNESVGGGPLEDIDVTATWLQDNDPGVTSVVITGPTQAVAAAAEASGADQAALLEVDFDRGAPEACG